MVKVNLIGFQQLQNILQDAPKKIVKEVGAEIMFAAEKFRAGAIKDAPADVGRLRQGISVKKINPLAAEVVSASEYSAPMEFGTKTKFRPITGIDSSEFKGFPKGSWKEFIIAIAKWVRRKKISGTYSVKTRRRKGSRLNQFAEDYQLAYVIARSIYRKGVTPHPFFFKQIAPVRRDLFRNVRNILKDIV